MKMKRRNKRRNKMFLVLTLSLMFVCVVMMGAVYGGWNDALTVIGNFTTGSMQAIFGGGDSGWELYIADADMGVLHTVDDETVRVLTNQKSTEISIGITGALPRQLLEQQDWTIVMIGPLDFSDDSLLTDIECFSGDERIRADVFASVSGSAVRWGNRLYETQSVPESLKFEALYGFEKRGDTFYASVQLIPTLETREKLLTSWTENPAHSENVPEGMRGVAVDSLDLPPELVEELNAAGVSDGDGAAELLLTIETAYSLNLTLPIQQKAYIPVNP